MWTMISCLLLVLMASLVNGDETTSVFGVVGRSIRLPCHVPFANVPNIEWSDMVWTEDANRKLIFRSENNPRLDVEASHPNRINYNVDGDFALSISRLDLDADPGLYICRSVVDGADHEKRYYLTVGNLPECAGAVHLTEGNSAELGCEMNYSGQQPVLQWFQGGEAVESQDLYDIRLAKKVLSLTATHDNDQMRFACRMSLGDVIEECHLVLNVSYLVRDIRFLPEKEKLRVGDDVKCIAKGNPSPVVTMLPETLQWKSGPGWYSMTIGQNWEGQRMAFHCSASNSVGSNSETLSSNVTIHIAAHRKQTSTTFSTVPTPVHHTRHHHQTSPSPSMKKDNTRGHRKHHSTTTIISARKEDVERPSPSSSFITAKEPSSSKQPVIYRYTYGETDAPVKMNTLAAKERQEAKPEKAAEATGAKPVQRRPSDASQVRCVGYFSLAAAATVLLIHLVLTTE